MQEFSSVIASSYDAESLAPMLTEKAAEGWSVVSIVSAGTNVVAYLTRGGGDGSAPVAEAPAAVVGVTDVPADDASQAAGVGVSVVADEGEVADVTVPSVPDMSDNEPGEIDTSGWGVGSEVAADDAPAAAVEAADAAADDQFSDGMGAVAGAAGIGADSGDLGAATLSSADIGAASESTDTGDSVTDVGADGVADVGDATTGLAGGIAPAIDDVGQAADESTTAADDTTAAVTDAGEGAAAHAGAASSVTGESDVNDAAGASQAADASAEADASADTGQDAPGVPAGWYADPSGRYELRYWDGAAWTEHVSRAGQQYTDPPVA